MPYAKQKSKCTGTFSLSCSWSTIFLYYAYAAARFSAYENVMWDIANEYHLFRTPEWAEEMGKLAPRNDLVSFGNLCLANEGKEYLIYTRVQHCRVQLPPHQRYSVMMINPRTGEITPQPDADSEMDNNAWQYRANLEENRVFILKRK